MTPAMIAQIATLVLELGITLARRAREDATDEERADVDRKLRAVVRRAEAELNEHPGEREG